MPYILVHRSDGSWAVQNKITKHFASKHTTKTKAQAQLRLLESKKFKKI